MALFGSPKPVVLKEGSTAEEQLRQMEAAKGTLDPRAEARLEKDLRLVRAGIDGERRILYELKNSHMDMFILQDLFLEHEGLTAQIDFLVITPQRNSSSSARTSSATSRSTAEETSSAPSKAGRGKASTLPSPRISGTSNSSRPCAKPAEAP